MTTTEHDNTAHYLGRCHCGFALRVEEGSAQTAERYRDMSTPGVPYRMGAQHYVRCPEGHKPFKLYRVEGEYSDKFQCDSRCENAKGHVCKCSCGGMNHGASYMVTPSVSLEPIVTTHDSPREIERLSTPVVTAVEITDQHIGTVGEHVQFEGKLTDRREVNGTILYIFTTDVRTPITGELLGEAKVEWWKPDWMEDPAYVIGEVYKLDAKVKRHDDSPKWGKATVVTYLEEV